MGDNIYLGDRDSVRTPMQWNGDRNAGFSTATPARLYSPVIMDPVWGYEAINVESQQGDPSSLLNWMRNMVALRKLFRVFGRGAIEFLDPPNRKVLAYQQLAMAMACCFYWFAYVLFFEIEVLAEDRDVAVDHHASSGCVDESDIFSDRVFRFGLKIPPSPGRPAMQMSLATSNGAIL